jgi:hypothetical protein
LLCRRNTNPAAADVGDTQRDARRAIDAAAEWVELRPE